MVNAFGSIVQGLQEEIDLNKGGNVEAKTHRLPEVDVAEI